MDFGKYKYETQKKESEARKKQKIIEIKEIKFRPNTDTHDYEVKMRSVVKFLEGGDKVKITLRFRGREMAHAELGRKLLERVADDVTELGKIEAMPAPRGPADGHDDQPGQALTGSDGRARPTATGCGEGPARRRPSGRAPAPDRWPARSPALSFLAWLPQAALIGLARALPCRARLAFAAGFARLLVAAVPGPPPPGRGQPPADLPRHGRRPSAAASARPWPTPSAAP